MAGHDPRYTDPRWRALAVMVKDRDHWQCQVRGDGCTKAGTSVDHITPPMEGGDFWDPANLRAACRPCNSKRGAAMLRDRSAYYRKTVARYVTRFG